MIAIGRIDINNYFVILQTGMVQKMSSQELTANRSSGQGCTV